MEHYRAYLEKLKKSLEQAWDGDWYNARILTMARLWVQLRMTNAASIRLRKPGP
jgi:hypothetical protein